MKIVKFIIGLVCLPFYPLFKWILDRADIIEKNKIKDDSLLLLKQDNDHFLNHFLKKHDAVMVLHNVHTQEFQFIPGENIVTTTGNAFYAESSCGQSPTNAYANLFLATAGPVTPAVGDDYDDFTVVSGSSKTKSSGYPKCPDTDTDNTGKGATVVTWKFEYLTTDGPFTSITHSFIAISGAGAGASILNSYKWGSAWNKDASTTATIYTNHTMLGS